MPAPARPQVHRAITPLEKPVHEYLHRESPFYNQAPADGSRQPGRDQPHPGYRQIDLGIPRRRRAPYYTFKSKPEICLCIVILLTSLSAGRWCPRFVLNRFRNTLPVERFGLQSPFERKGFRQVADFVVASLEAELACNL